MKLALPKGATSQTVLIFIQDSTSTGGAGKTGLAFNTASLTAYYARPRAAAVAITLATQTVTGAYSSGGFVEIDATNMPGLYRFDPPDAVLATGVDSVVVMLKGATGMAPLPLEIQLTDFNLNDADPAVDVTKWNGTAVAAPNVAGVPKVDLTHWLGTAAATPTVAGVPEVDVTHVGGAAETIGARLDAAVSTRATPAQVNTELLDVLNTDTFAEPGQEAPPATTTLAKKLGYLYKAFRNKLTQTSTTLSVFADDGSTVDQKATVSDDGTTYTRGELGTGP
jgi:hypothetical protein